MEFRELQQIEHAPTLESVPLETDLQEDTHEATQSASGSVSQKSVARQPTLQYVLVQNELNALLMDHLEKESGIFIHAASPLLAFLDLLTSVIQKKNVQPDVLAQLNATGSQVVYTLHQVEAVDYAPFITCIRKILGDKENSLEKAARARDNVDTLLAHPTDRPVSAASPDLSPNNRVSIAPDFLPAIGRLIEMASSRTISEALRLALIDLACMLKSSPAVTHTFAVSVLEHYHQLKQQFPAVDTTGALLGELTKLSLLEASSRIDQPPADFEF